MKNPPSYILPAAVFAIFCFVFGWFYFFNQFWTHIATDRFQALVEYPGPQFRGHRGLQILVHRQFLPVMQRLDAYAANRHLHILITGSFRPPDKKISSTIVAPAVRSNHLAGHAVDFNVVYADNVYESEDLNKAAFHTLPEPVKRFFEDIRQDSGMRWGGDFEAEDPVHLDDGLNINQPDVWEMHYQSCFADYAHAEHKWVRWVKGLFL